MEILKQSHFEVVIFISEGREYMVLPIKNFKGRLAGLTIEDLRRQLDYNIDNQKERLILLTNIVNVDGLPNSYFAEYFDTKINSGIDYSHFKVNINKTDYLSHEINICRVLEILADYILYSPDNAPLVKKTKYKFYRKGKFKQKLSAEVSLDAIVENINESTGGSHDRDIIGEVIDFLIRDQGNYRVKIEQRISSPDLEEEELSCIKEYQNLIDAMQNTIERIEEEGVVAVYGEDKVKLMLNKTKDQKLTDKELNSLQGKLRYKLRKQKSYTKNDQIYCKDHLKGTIYFKSALKGEENTNWLLFNFTDIDQIKALLKLNVRNVNTDKSILTMDLNNLLESVILNKKERIILELYMENDATFEAISEVIGDSPSAIKQTIDRIIKKIINKYEENYMDWVYLNYIKGVYKKCKICGDIKLTQRFNKDKTKKHGVKNICKKCLKSNK